MSGKKIVLVASRTESNEREQDCWVQMLFATLPANIAHYFTDLTCLENEVRPDGQARYVPNGLRVVESILLQEFSPEEVAVCYPDQLETFIGEDTRAVGVHAHNPLGITFATDVYAQLAGPQNEPLNATEFKKLILSAMGILFHLLALQPGFLSPQPEMVPLLFGDSGLLLPSGSEAIWREDQVSVVAAGSCAGVGVAAQTLFAPGPSCEPVSCAGLRPRNFSGSRWRATRGLDFGGGLRITKADLPLDRAAVFLERPHPIRGGGSREVAERPGRATRRPDGLEFDS